MAESRRLGPEAYGGVSGEAYRPYVPAGQKMAEFTVRSVVIGSLIGIVFGAANAYLGLKVSMTVSASIPAAIIAIAVGGDGSAARPSSRTTWPRRSARPGRRWLPA